MITRISGICAGVLLSLLVSVFVFPRSASQVPPVRRPAVVSRCCGDM